MGRPNWHGQCLNNTYPLNRLSENSPHAALGVHAPDSMVMRYVHLSKTHLLLGLILCLLASVSARAQTASWNKTGIQSWTTAANWSWTGSVPAGGLPDSATTVALSNGGTIQLKDTSQSISAYTMSNSRLEIIQGSGTSVLTVANAVTLGAGSGVSSVLIDGLGSELNKTLATGQVHIGSSTGATTLTISNQGKLTSAGAVHLGLATSLTGAASTLNVNTGGQMIVNSTFMIGYRGNGTMNIESGGYVKSTNGFIAGYGPDANRIQGKAEVKVSGEGSKWDVGAIYVGHTGTGTVIVENGGMINSTSIGWIGYFNNGPTTGTPPPTQYGDGTVTVQTNGIWQSTGNLNVGTQVTTGDYPGTSKGTLNVATGGRVNIGAGSGIITLGDDGWMNIGSNPLLDGALPVGPGIVSAASITGGVGRTLTLFHNDMTGNYHLSKTGVSSGAHVALTGGLGLQVLSGSTTLVGINSYTGGTVIGGMDEYTARLAVKHSGALGTGSVLVKKNGILEVAPTTNYAQMGILEMEGGSALAMKVNPNGGSNNAVFELREWFYYSGDPDEKITLYLSGTDAITHPELYDWTFLRATGGVFADVTNLFEIVSDIPGFYVFQRDDTLVLGLTLVPEPGRLALCLMAFLGVWMRRRRVRA
jgi:T5SS/PEP-CTERM-associated repeat protein